MVTSDSGEIIETNSGFANSDRFVFDGPLFNDSDTFHPAVETPDATNVTTADTGVLNADDS